MRVAVDLDRCQGNGACMDAAPEVFEGEFDGSVRALREEPGPHLRRAVRPAARRCPTQAMTVQG